MSKYIAVRNGMTSCEESDLAHIAVDFLQDGGVVSKRYANAFKVNQLDTPAMGVKINAGRCYVPGVNAGGSYMVWSVESDIQETLTLGGSDPSYSRYDIVCVKVDVAIIANADASNVVSLVVVVGSPSGSPVVPSVPLNHYKLAEILVGAGTTTVTNSDITSKRVEAGPVKTGGWLNGDYAAGSIDQTAAPTLTRLYGAATSGRLGTPPASDTGMFLTQTGSMVLTLDGSSHGTITYERPFPNGLLSAFACDGDSEGSVAYGKTVGTVAGDSDLSILKIRCTKAQDDSSMAGIQVRIDYISWGW